MPEAGGVVHDDHGVQFTSWMFTQKIRSAGLLPSFGSVGDGLDNAMMEPFWPSMQIELLNRQKWQTRVVLANRGVLQAPTPLLRPRPHHSTAHRRKLVRTSGNQTVGMSAGLACLVFLRRSKPSTAHPDDGSTCPGSHLYF